MNVIFVFSCCQMSKIGRSCNRSFIGNMATLDSNFMHQQRIPIEQALDSAAVVIYCFIITPIIGPVCPSLQDELQACSNITGRRNDGIGDMICWLDVGGQAHTESGPALRCPTIFFTNFKTAQVTKMAPSINGLGNSRQNSFFSNPKRFDIPCRKIHTSYIPYLKTKPNQTYKIQHGLYDDTQIMVLSARRHQLFGESYV